MADEITVISQLKVAGTSVTLKYPQADDPDESTYDMSGADVAIFEQDIGTSEEAIVFPASIGTKGWVYAKNLDDTNYVSFRAATGETDFMELKAGEANVFRLSRSATAPYGIADTAEVKCLFMVAED